MEQHKNGDVRKHDKHTGTWVVAHTLGASYIGRIHEIEGRSPYEWTHVDRWQKLAEHRQDTPVSEVLDGQTLTLMPSFDFVAPWRQVPVTKDGRPELDATGRPVVAMLRDPCVSGYGFCYRPVPVHIPGVRSGTSLVFFSQMDEADRELYWRFVQSASQQMDGRAAARSGIAIPDDKQVLELGKHART